MHGATVIFYLLAAFTLVCALLAVTTRQIFRAAVFLLFSLIGVAGLFFWMQYEFIAAVQIVVYVGGITVLIIFSIFLTQQAGELLPKQNTGRQIMAFLAALCGFLLVLIQVFQHSFKGDISAPVSTGVENIGNSMLGIDEGGYALPFELVSILLLAALIGCIVIAIKKEPEISINNTKMEKQEDLY